MENDLNEAAITNDAGSVDASPAATADASPKQDAAPANLDTAVRRAFEKLSADPAEIKTEPVKAEPAKAEAKTEPTEVKADPLPTDVDPVTGEKQEPIRAPASMSPALREQWGSLPRQMQKYWVDRERDMATRLNETADDRKLAKDFRDVVAPYEVMFRQYGVSAAQMGRELYQHAYTLNTGSPQQKAHLIHAMIQRFQPDLATLSGLAGASRGTMPPAPQPVDVQAEVQKALAAQEEQRATTDMQTALSDFQADTGHEFYEDVRGTMGKLIESGLVTGRNLPELLKNAYAAACQHVPEVKDVLAQRAAVKAQAAPVAAPTAKPVTQAKPSLGGGRSTAAAQKSMSLDDAARAAYRALSGAA